MHVKLDKAINLSYNMDSKHSHGSTNVLSREQFPILFM